MIRSRRFALRAVAAATLLAVLALLGPILLLAVAFWAPISTLGTIFPEEELRLHLIHGVGVSLALWTVVIGVGLQLRRPERSVSPLWVAAFYIAVGASLAALSGAFEPIFWIPFLVLVGLVLVLHPARTASLRVAHRPLAILAAVGSVPLMVYGYNQLVLQLGGVVDDPHVAGVHYSTMALLAVIILIGTWLGSTDVPGAHVTALIAAGSMVLFGVASLLNSDQVSSLPAFWASAATVWGAAYLVVASRTVSPQPGHIQASRAE